MLTAEVLRFLRHFIAAASTQRPPDPAQRVTRLIGFMRDIENHPGHDLDACLLTMAELRNIVTAESTRAASRRPASPGDAANLHPRAAYGVEALPLAVALALRQRGDVSDYRNRLNSAQTRLEGGNDDRDWSEELQRAKNAVQAALRVKPSVTTLHLDVVPPRIGVDQEVDTSPLRSWLLSAWPGKRYRRVLSRLVTAQAAGKQIDRGLEMIWRAG